MKKLLLSVWLFTTAVLVYCFWLIVSPITVFAQPTQSANMRSTNGTAYGATLLGNTRLGTGVLATNLIGYGGLTLNSGTAEFGLNLINSGDINASDVSALTLFSFGSVVGGGVFSGDGSGLTNLANVIQSHFTQNINYSGKMTFLSNVFLSQLSFATNAGAVNVLNLNCTDQAITTNNNVNFTGFNIPAEYGVTNSAWASVIITNNGVSPIMLTFPGCIGDTNVWVTNQAAFMAKKYPQYGTNVVFNSLK